MGILSVFLRKSWFLGDKAKITQCRKRTEPVYLPLKFRQFFDGSEFVFRKLYSCIFNEYCAKSSLFSSVAFLLSFSFFRPLHLPCTSLSQFSPLFLFPLIHLKPICLRRKIVNEIPKANILIPIKRKKLKTFSSIQS